jgi:hypothetical protein
MKDADDSFETLSSSTALPEEADGGNALAAEPTPAPKAEAASMTESEPGRDAAKAAAFVEPPSGLTVDQPAAGEAAAMSSARPAAAEVVSPGKAAKGQTEADAALREAPHIEPQRATLIPFVPPQPKNSPFSAFGRFATDRRFQTGAAAACLALVAIVAGGATLQARSQGESQRLAQAVSALDARLDAIEAARPHEEAAEIRKAVAEARGGLASAHDLSATVAQLNARLDRVEREQQARLDKLGDRLERDAAARNADAQARGADLVARIDKLEKADAAARIERLEKADLVGRIDRIEKADVAARIDKVEKKMQSAAAQPPAAPLPPQKAAAAAQGVSNEVTGSIEKPHPSEPIRGWFLVEMRNGSAIVENRQGERQIEPGDVLPGAGKVERFEKRGRDWIVVTDQGVIPQAPAGSYAPRVVLRPPMYGPYGGFGPGYGGYED